MARTWPSLRRTMRTRSALSMTMTSPSLAAMGFWACGVVAASVTAITGNNTECMGTSGVCLLECDGGGNDDWHRGAVDRRRLIAPLASGGDRRLVEQRNAAHHFRVGYRAVRRDVELDEHHAAHAGVLRLHRKDRGHVDDFDRSHDRAADTRRRRPRRGTRFRLVHRVAAAAAAAGAGKRHDHDGGRVPERARVTRSARAAENLNESAGRGHTDAGIARLAGHGIIVEDRAPLPALAERPLALDTVEREGDVHSAVRLGAVDNVVGDHSK